MHNYPSVSLTLLPPTLPPVQSIASLEQPGVSITSLPQSSPPWCSSRHSSGSRKVHLCCHMHTHTHTSTQNIHIPHVIPPSSTISQQDNALMRQRERMHQAHNRTLPLNTTRLATHVLMMSINSVPGITTTIENNRLH